MDKKSQQQPTQNRAKKYYRPPMLTAYGKLHNIVAAGSSGRPEGNGNSKNRRA